MKRPSNHAVKQIVLGLTLVLFVAGYGLILRAGFSDVKHLFSFLVASYLVIWGGYSLVSASSRDEIRIRFVLLTLSLVSALFLAELPALFKVVDYRRIFSNTDGLLWEQPGYYPDVELLAQPQPHSSATIGFHRGNIGDALCLPTRQSQPFQLRYDQNGFRNEQDLASAEIAVIGDSYVESQMLPATMLATTRLGEVTRKTVANLGRSGYGPQQELAVLKRYALPLHPHDVVWVFYEGNDLFDAQAYDELATRLRPQLRSREMVWNRSFTRNSLFWLVRAIQGCIPAPGLAIPATVLDNEGTEHHLYVKGRSNSVSLTQEDLDALKISMAAIQEAHELVQKEGARLMVVFAPTAFRVYQGIADFEKAGKDTAPPWAIDDLPDRLRKMISEISPNIGYLDLTPILKAAARRTNPIFLPDDTHWSSEGHQVVAQALAEALTAATQMEAEKRSPEMQHRKESVLLSSNAIMIRNTDGTIRYWSKGAQELYGWEPDDALGMSSHLLLETVFPVPLEIIEEQLRKKGYWEGQLIHKRRDGTKIAVSSHWDFQQNPTSHDQSITIIEVNGPTKS